VTLFITCHELSKSFGSRTLFTELSLSIFEKERIALIGPNGSGKTTLLKIIAGVEKQDSGTITMKRSLRIGYLPQECLFEEKSVKEVLLDALQKVESEEYEKEVLADTWLSKLGFSGSEPKAHLLSGGWKKRLALGCELVLSPDILLLDEPTNHLDLEGILWLERFLKQEAPSYLLVSHDRSFLQQAADRVIEINPTYPKGMLAIKGSYSHFLEKKEAFLEGQLEQERSLASLARKETDWLSRSPKARTCKSKSRVDAAHELLEELSSVEKRNTQKLAQIAFIGSERETQKLVVAKNVGKRVGENFLFQHLDLTLSPGSRLGLIGPNGSGKTTLLRLIAGETTPDQGTIKSADDLKIIYFDQHRVQLPLSLSLREALSPNGDFVTYHGRPIHVNGWCQRFLFSPSILDLQIGKLSGGERARIAIAHLMLQPADLLLLDEPTNDLDIPTLETLEESLIDFPGAVVLISHDRFMLERTCNQILSLSPGSAGQTFADYTQWEAANRPRDTAPKSREKNETAPKKQALSYAEKKEYEGIEAKLATLEAKLQMLNESLMSQELATDPSRLAEICLDVSLTETQVEQLYLRFEELAKKI